MPAVSELGERERERGREGEAYALGFERRLLLGYSGCSLLERSLRSWYRWIWDGRIAGGGSGL